jgi:GWxTD domain-containing protein
MSWRTHFTPFSRRLNCRLLAQTVCLLACLTELCGKATAQDGWLSDVLIQRLPTGESYAEMQMSWTSQPNTPSDSITITMIATNNEGVLDFRKDKVLGRPMGLDSVVLEHVHVRRLEVPSGNVRFEWLAHLGDSLLHLHNENLRIQVGGMPEFTDVMIVSTHGPASAVSQPDMVHSGLDLIPLVGRQIPIDAASVRFYVELHGVADIVGQDSLFLLTYGWANERGEWDSRMTKYQRRRAAGIVPIFESLPTSPSSPLPQSPVLKLQASTREGEVIVSRDISLAQRQSASTVNGEVGSLADAGALLPSLTSYADRAAMVRHLEDHLAIASINEQNTIQNTLIPSGDVMQMKQYVTGFWLEQSTSLAEAHARHVQHADRIAFVDEAYGDCKDGRGSLTEMGNIYLRFGKPNTVVKRHHDTEYYPYEIWHYHKAGRFNNKRFLFFAPHVVAECMELLHSDMLGERQNEDWLSQLRSRENRLSVSKSMENRLNPRDSYSREEPEDLFFNPR